MERFCISMSVGYTVENDSHVCINFAVSDTGIGIPEDKQASLFESFSQLDASTARKYGGTGLGLTISSRLVQLMGGKLQVKSQPGQGSIFSFSIELEVCKPVGNPPIPNIEGRKILLLDTNKRHAELIHQHLRDQEVELKTVFLTEGMINYPPDIEDYDLVLFNMMCEAKS